PQNLTVTNNVLHTFDCGIAISEAYNPVVSFNIAYTTSYAAFSCNHCTGTPQQTIWQGNIAYDLNPGGTQNTNTYGIKFSPTVNGSRANMTAVNNMAFNSTWVCFDNHGGTNIRWLNNLCVGPGGTGGNAAGVGAHGVPSTFPTTNGILQGNVVDNGYNGTAVN